MSSPSCETDSSHRSGGKNAGGEAAFVVPEKPAKEKKARIKTLGELKPKHRTPSDMRRLLVED